MPQERLNIFVSYADEDVLLAKEIRDQLLKAFSPILIQVTIAAGFALGTDWRKEIADRLDKADIMLIVATGRQKLSHSFTGFEVGYFYNSRNTRRRMASFDSDRLLIPIAVFTKAPQTVDDVQGIEFDGPLNPLTIDAKTLKDKTAFMRSLPANAVANPLLALFKRVQSIIKTTVEFSPEELQAFNDQLTERAEELHATLFEEMKKRVSTEVFPERKIVIRLPSAARSDSLASATIEFVGQSFDTFGFGAPDPGERSWTDFLESIDDARVAKSWVGNIQALVTEARNGECNESRQLITSRDQRRLFRMFVARNVLYLSGINEIHIYVVEIRPKDFGDPITTLLLKAISVGLQYRFMFLEGKASQFSPETFNAVLLDNLKPRVSELIQELDYLLWQSEEARLSEPENILPIYRHDLEPGEIEQKFQLWEENKTKLYAAAHQVLDATAREQLDKAARQFRTTLADFCRSTAVMNREYTGNVLEVLQEIVMRTPAQGGRSGGPRAVGDAAE